MRSTSAWGWRQTIVLVRGKHQHNSISVMRINANCSLSALRMFTVPGSPSGMKITSNGDYLIAAYIGQVDSFKIDPITGDLTELGPFKTQGAAAGVEITCEQHHCVLWRCRIEHAG